MKRKRRIDKKAGRQRLPYLNIPFAEQLRNPWKPYEIATEQMIADIDDASMHILENTGIRFQDETAMDIWEKAGAKVERSSQHVWPDRGLIREAVAKAPSDFTLHARNPARSRFIGQNSINFFPNAGMVFASDLDRGRRPGTEADWLTCAKLIQMTNVIHFAPTAPVVMHDVPVHRKHLLSCLYGSLYSDKPYMGRSHGYVIPQDIIDMMTIIFGRLPEDGPLTGGNINVNSPLVYDDRMLGGMITFARAKQFIIVTPFILAGAMSPVTMAAAVAQQNAEALAGIALLQLVTPAHRPFMAGLQPMLTCGAVHPRLAPRKGLGQHFWGRSWHGIISCPFVAMAL